MIGDHPNRVWLAIRWRREVEAADLRAALAALHGLSSLDRRNPLVLRTVGTTGGLRHYVAVPEPSRGPALSQLRQALIGCSMVEDNDVPYVNATLVARMHASTRQRVLHTDEPERTAAALLRALVPAARGEQIVLQIDLGPVRRPLVTPAEVPLPWSLARLIAGQTTSTTAESRRAFADKFGEPGWRAAVYVAARAASVPRARKLLADVAATLRTLEGPGVRLSLKPVASARALDVPPLRYPLALNLSEAVSLSAWPCGPVHGLPIDRLRTRVVPAARIIPRRGRVVAEATEPGQEWPLALSVTDSMQHLQILGPTGTGKSTAMLSLIVQDMRAGRGVVVVDPKGDLIQDVLQRVPKDRRDVVVLDPSDDDRPVGLNPLASSSSPELIADQLLSVFKRLYAGSWGPRLQEILHAGLLTVASHSGLTLCHLPMLYLNPSVRRRLSAPVAHDPALGPFWAWFEGMSDAERAVALAPVMNKLRAFLLRPSLRGVLGQVEPKFDVARAIEQRAVVLVSLAKGRLGPEAAQLFGGLAVAQLWQAVQARTRIAADRRVPVFVYLDEFQDYLALPTDFADFLAQARGFRMSCTLAHQHLGQLPPDLRSAVLANARSKLVFQTTHEDAAVLARSHPEIMPEDLVSLGSFEAYVQLVANGAVMPFASARTYPPPPVCSRADVIRADSRDRYGVERDTVEAELRRFGLNEPVDTGPIGQRRRTDRRTGGAS